MVQGAKDWKKAKRRLHVALNTPELAEAVRLLPIAEESSCLTIVYSLASLE